MAPFLKTTIKSAVSALLIFLVAGFYFGLVRPPRDFPTGDLIRIESGKSLSQISYLLKEEQIVRSSNIFQFFAILFGGDRKAQAGDYVFKEPLPASQVARRIISGEYGIEPIKVTIPEGKDSKEIAALLEESLPHFEKEPFLSLAGGHEGYLFPDTYFFPPTVDEEEIISIMNANFNKKIEALLPAIEQSGRELDEIITMASLVEKEAHKNDQRKIIAGVLWKRLERKMPLQVDAAFLYINGKSTFDLTQSDLGLDNPYNTYRNVGFPPTPITNPGLDSILAALYPEDSPYLYYLHDNSGNIYFASDFEEHKRNKKRYLR